MLPAVFFCSYNSIFTSYVIHTAFKNPRVRQSVRARFRLLLPPQCAAHARHLGMALDVTIAPEQSQRDEAINQHHHVVQNSEPAILKRIRESLQPSWIARVDVIWLAIRRPRTVVLFAPEVRVAGDLFPERRRQDFLFRGRLARANLLGLQIAV